MISIVKKYYTKKSLLVLLMLFSFYPYVFCYMLHVNAESILLVAYTILFLFLINNQKTKIFRFPRVIRTVLVVQAITWFVYFAIHADSSYLTRILFIILTYASLSTLLYEGSIVQFGCSYNKFLTVIAIAGIPVFFLFALGMLQPFFTFNNLDGREAGFFGLTCSNSYTAGICRVAGFFDEPGALAFWGIYALIINKLFYNSRFVEMGLIIGLLTTLSAAYFVQLFLYVLLFYMRNIKQFTLIVIILLSAGYFTVKELGENEQLAYLTIERFEGGQIRSSRNEMAKEAKKVFSERPIFGVGAKKLQEIGYFDDNPYEILAKDGIIGFFITYLPLFIILIRYGKKNPNLLRGILILAAGYLQRPFHINELHFFMLYLFVVFAVLKYDKGVSFDKVLLT